MNRCGSVKGYRDHVRRGETTCQPCRDAQATWQRRYEARRYLARGPLWVSSVGTVRRLQALAYMGWSHRALAARLGVKTPAVDNWARRDGLVHRDTAGKVAALYDELWNVPGPSRSSALRAAGRGWASPLAWSDDEIDDPAARPHRDADGPVAFDEVAIARAMRGDDVHLRPVEKAEAVRRMTANGLSAAEIAARLRMEQRSVHRLRNGSGPSQVAS